LQSRKDNVDNVTKSNGSFQTSIFRKSTFTGLSTGIFSFCSFRFKLNWIKTLLNRGFRICSTFNAMHTEFEFLRSIFSLNGFPSLLVYTQIKKFMSRHYNKVAPDCGSWNLIYCSFPYFGKAPETMAKELKVLINKYLLNVNLPVILVNNFKIGSFSRYKDALPLFMRSSLVCRYNCAQSHQHASVCRLAIFTLGWRSIRAEVLEREHY
jgi:hypothetical protein